MVLKTVSLGCVVRASLMLFYIPFNMTCSCVFLLITPFMCILQAFIFTFFIHFAVGCSFCISRNHKVFGYSHPQCRPGGVSICFWVIKFVGVPQLKPIHRFSPNFHTCVCVCACMCAIVNFYTNLFFTKFVETICFCKNMSAKKKNCPHFKKQHGRLFQNHKYVLKLKILQLILSDLCKM